MEKLFFFTSSDLMVRVVYDERINSLRYSSHRKLDMGEKLAVESYILINVSPDTEYCKRSPSLLVYMGVDKNLSKEYQFYQLKNTIENVIVEKHEIDEQVKALIDSSMSKYYFEQIGNEILSLRKEIKKGSEQGIQKIIYSIIELVEAYNIHSGKKIAVEDVIPEELRLCLQA